MQDNYAVLVPDLMDSELTEIEDYLPPHISYDAFVRCAKTSILNGGDILKAEKNSVIAALSRCAMDGLLPDNKEAAILSFNCNEGSRDKPNWVTKAQYLPMVDGILKRARMSGEVKNISGKALFEKDQFRYWIDENGEHLSYIPFLDGNAGAMVGCFAYALLNNGAMMIEHMNMETINQIKSASKTSNFANSPWKKWFDRMAIKSVLHRLCRRLPNASELVAMCEQGMNMNFDKSKEVKDITEYYSQDIFEDNLEQYTKLIQAGKKTGGQIIKFLQSKHQLSQQQIETLKGIDNV